jgi:hypothetical protein
VGPAQTVTKLLTHGKWSGLEVARLIIVSAEDLNWGRESALTAAEANRLRQGLSPEAWREYVRWVTGWLFIEDHLLPAGRIALLEATRGLLAAEVLLTRVLDLAVYRNEDVDTLTAWTSSVRTLLLNLHPYASTRGRALVWLSAGADAFMAALGLTTLRACELLQELIKELEEAVAHTMEIFKLLKAIDIQMPELPPLNTLGPSGAAARELGQRMQSRRPDDWPTLWAWWLGKADEVAPTS